MDTDTTIPSGLETTTLVTDDGRSYTGVGGDEKTTTEALANTSFGKPTGESDDQTPRDDRGKFVPAKADDRPTRGQRRFAKFQLDLGTVSRERDELRSQYEANQAELTKLRQEFEALKAAPPSAPASETPKPAETPAEAQKRLMLDDFKAKPETAVEDYVEAAIEKGLQERLQTELDRRLATERATTALQGAIADSRERGEKTYPDFGAKVASSTVYFPAVILESIARAPGSEHIQYALASDPDLAQRIASMANDKGLVVDPVVLGMELGRLGTAPTRAASPASRTDVVVSRAPAPVQPVVGGSRTASRSLEEIAASGSYDDYKRARHASMGVTAR